jgi:hypothetical protein
MPTLAPHPFGPPARVPLTAERTPWLRPRAEALEPRLLHSADLAPLVGATAGWAAAEVAPLRTDDPCAAQQGGAEIAFVDASLPDAAVLLADLRAQQQAGRPLEIVTFDAGADGLAVISEALAGRSGLSAVHVLTHGSDGALQLGATRLDAQTLLRRAAEVGAWGSALAADGDLLLYGCDLAAGDAGQRFVQDLAALTGADVAASTDRTGAAALGGNWVLEHHSGAIEAGALVSAAAQAEWAGTLVTVTVDSGQLDYQENQAPVAIAPSLAVSAAAGPDIVSATVWIADGYASGQDVLSFTNQLGITGSWDGGTGVLTLSGTASVADYQTALRSVTYVNTSDDPSGLNRNISFVVNDGTAASTAAVRTVSVTPVVDHLLTVDTTTDVVDGVTTSIDALLANRGADGLISLREAVTAANNTAGIDTIVLPGGSYGLTRTGGSEDHNVTGDLDVRDSVVISGAGASTTTISAGNLSGVFHVISGTLTMSGVTIRDGAASNGAGVMVNNGASLVLSQSVVRNNAATEGGGGVGLLTSGASISLDRVQVLNNTAQYGGGVYIYDGSLTATDTTVDGNTTTQWAGGIYIEHGTGVLNRVTSSNNSAGLEGGGIMLEGGAATLSITNATVSGNGSAVGGGGIYVWSGALTVSASTIANNDAPSGAGIYLRVGGSASLSSTIVAGNTGSGNANQALTSLGYNLDSGNTLGLNQASDLVNTDPLLAPLADNGGFTPTHALSGTSPALDRGDPGAPAIDQRGTARSGTPDIGAFEYIAPNVAPIVASSGGTAGYTENDAATVVDPALTVSDADSASLAGATVSISANYASGQDVLSFTNQLGITGSWDAGTGVLTLSGTASVADYQTALRSVTFHNTSDAPSTATRQVRFEVDDGAGPGVSDERGVKVNAVNDAPALGDGTLAAIDEDTANPPGQAVGTIFAGQFSDPDAGASLAGIAVVGNTADAATQGTWQYSSNGGTDWFAIGSVADGAGALAISSASLVRFVPVADYHGTPPALVVRGLDDTYAGGFSSTAGAQTRVNVDTTTRGGTTAIAAATATLSTTINPLDDAPVNTVPGSQVTGRDTPLVFSAAGGNAISVADIDSPTLQVTLQASGGTLTLAGTAGLAFSTGNGSGNATMVFSGSITAINTALNGLRLDPAAGTTGAATVQIVTSDGTSSAGSVVNVAVAEHSLWLSTHGDATSSAASGNLSWAHGAVVSLGHPNLALGAGTTGGTFTLASNLSALAADGNVDIVGLHVVGRAVTVGSVNPVQLQAGDLLFSVANNETFGGVAVTSHDVVLFRPATPGNYASGTFSVLLRDPTGGGRDVRDFALVEAPLTVGGTALQAGDFLMVFSGGSYDRDVSLFRPVATGTASSGAAPVEFVNGDGGGFNFGRGISGVELVNSTVTIGGRTLTAGQLLLSLDGPATVGSTALSVQEHDAFVLDLATSGAASSGTASMLMRGADLGLSAGGERPDALALVARASAAPVLAAGGTLAYTENDAPAPVAPAATVSDADSAHFGGGTLLVEFSANGTADDRLGIRDEGSGAGQIGVAGADVTYGGVVIGSFTGGTDGATPLIVSLNTNATADAVQALLRNVTYANASEAPSTPARTVRFVVTDGGGGLSNAAMSTVNVTAANDAPVNAVPAAQATALNTPLVFSVANGNAIVVSDADAGAAPLEVTLTVSNGRLTLAATAGLTFATGNGIGDRTMTFTGTLASINAALDGLRFDPDTGYGGFATLTITTDDLGNSGGSSLPDTDNVTIAVAVPNTAPVLNGANALVTIGEDAVGNGGTLVSQLIAGQITDPDAGAQAGIAVTAVDNTNGTWQYSTDGGDSWLAFGTPSVNNARLLAADAATYVRFVPNANWHGPAGAGLTFRAWDRTSGTAGGEADVVSVTQTVRDNFSTVSYGNNDGSALWSGPWVAWDSLGGGPSSGNVQVSGGALLIRAAGVGEGAWRQADLGGANSATLTFTYNNQLAAGAQITLVARQGQGAFTTLATFSPASLTGTGTFSVDISAFIGSATWIGFRVAGANSLALPNTLAVDNVQIAYTMLASGGTGAFSTASASAGVVVQSVNDAPSGADRTVTTPEDAAYTFTVADFGLADADDAAGPGGADGLAAVRLTTLPGAGTLLLNGVAVTAAQEVSAADIAAGLLRFVPAADANGAGYASFTFQVRDDGGTADGGIDLDPTPRTMVVDVTPVNDAPSGTGRTVVTAEDGGYAFTVADFGFADAADAASAAGADDLLAVRITTLPAAGALLLNGVAVVVAQEVSAADIAAGLLRFVPAADANGAGYASFTFQVRDDGGTTGGGVDLDPTPRTLTVDVTSVNDAPSGASRTVVTLEDSDYTFGIADFGFADAADAASAAGGNNLLAVRITTLPAAGALLLDGVAVTAAQEVSAADIAAGLLRFVPAADANGAGYASFTFQVRDGGGTAGGGIDLDPTPRTMVLDVTPVNDAPRPVSQPADQSVLAGALVSFALPQPTFVDVDAGDTVTVVALLADGSALPAWLRLDATTLTFTAGPGAAEVGLYVIRVTATDAAGAVGEARFVLHVTALPVAGTAVMEAAPQPPAAPPKSPDAAPPAPAPEPAPPATGRIAGGAVAPLSDLFAASTHPEPAAATPAPKAPSAQGTGRALGSKADAVLAEAVAHEFKALSLEATLQVFGSEEAMRRLEEVQRRLLEEQAARREQVAASLAAAGGLSIGYVVWLLRGGVLLSSLLSALPAWQMLDPLPVVAGTAAAKARRQPRTAGEHADADVERLFDHRKLAAGSTRGRANAGTPTATGAPPAVQPRHPMTETDR